MKRSDIELLTEGVIYQGRSPAPNGNNLVGAIKTISNMADIMEKRNFTSVSELTDREQQKLEDAQEDFQYLFGELGSTINEVTGDDGTLELSDGTVVDLPRAATSTKQTVDAPDNSGGS